METVRIMSCVAGKILFEHEEENNSVAKALVAAVDAGVNLRNADLSNADLRNADLSYADLSNVNLSNVNLRNADLRNADLSNADLSYADLRNADLSNADLSYANVCYSRGWTFACSHSRFKISANFARQVLAHLASCTSDDKDFNNIKEMILPEAKKSHRAGDLGLLG